MSRNDASDFAHRLYARVPAQYRVEDAERGKPLLVLLRVIGEQVANIRQDLDALWDNFFIETCDDWVVPYIGALVGTKLLEHPVGQSERLDVWNTVASRRLKGTPRMLETLSQAISEWPTNVAEFFQTLGWSQNMNHLRLEHPLTPDLRDVYRLSLLGTASDPFAHAADFKPPRPLDQPRVTRGSLGIGHTAWGTPGRHQIKNVGFFVRRLHTFPVRGATPGAVPPRAGSPPEVSCFTFDPLLRDMPLFVEKSRAPLTRAAFDLKPWETFGSDLAVRQFGVLLASEVEPSPVLSSGHFPFTFGKSGVGLSLHATAGMRLLEPRQFQLGAAHFVITAEWYPATGTPTSLGTLSTLYAAVGEEDAFQLGSAAPGPGQLALSVQTGRPTLSSPGPIPLPPSPAARFPGAVIAIRAARMGPVHDADGRYVYLPAAFVTPSDKLTYYVADDGSTYTSANLDATALAGESEGQVYPPRPLSPSTAPANAFTRLNRRPQDAHWGGGLRLTDPTRFAGTSVLVQAELFTGVFQPLGAIATSDQKGSDYDYLEVPDPWPAFTYGPSHDAVAGRMPADGLLSIRIKALQGDFIPPAELVVVNRSGQSLLVYLPEVQGAAATEGIQVFVANDGATYLKPDDPVILQGLPSKRSYRDLIRARAAAGQVLPIPGLWPLQQRRPVAINLCRCERGALLSQGELGIDPEVGRFAFAPHDPTMGEGRLSVDYVEAFTDSVGALNFDRQLDQSAPATRLVSQSGDADAPLISGLSSAPTHSSVTGAIAAAQDGDVIEILDSATYAESVAIALDKPSVKSLTLRAGPGQRPCITFDRGPDVPAPVSFYITVPMLFLEMNGLLISGGALLIEKGVQQLRLTACSLDPRNAPGGSLIATSLDPVDHAQYLLCRCITGGLRLGPGVNQLTVADSIIDQRDGWAISGLSGLGSPPAFHSPPEIAPLGIATASVQLERATVFGRVSCDLLNASECLLDDIAEVEDRQSGCVRFSRYERGSVLPRRYLCVPSDQQVGACIPGRRCLPPLFNSRRFGRPDYAQLGAACPREILTASERNSEVGAFARAFSPIRLSNLQTKLQEFMPVGLSAVIIAAT